jgi:hypothetical protein
MSTTLVPPKPKLDVSQISEAAERGNGFDGGGFREVGLSRRAGDATHTTPYRVWMALTGDRSP